MRPSTYPASPQKCTAPAPEASTSRSQSSRMGVSGERASFPRVVVVADEPNELERLVAQRIREQLGEGGLQGLIEARQQLEAQLQGSGRLEAEVRPVEAQFGDSVRTKDSADVVISPDPAVLVLQTSSPGLANDIKGRSPQDITLAINIY